MFCILRERIVHGVKVIQTKNKQYQSVHGRAFQHKVTSQYFTNRDRDNVQQKIYTKQCWERFPWQRIALETR